MTTSYYIKVKDSTGDTMRYVADGYEFTDDGDLILYCGNEEVTYNMSFVIYYSISESTSMLSDKEISKVIDEVGKDK